MLYWLHRRDGGGNINKEADFCATTALCSPPSPIPPLSLYPVLCPPTLESLLTADFFQPPPPHSLFDLPTQVEATRRQSLSIYRILITSTMTPRRRCRKAHARTDDPPCPHASQCPQGRNLDSSAENIKQMRHAHAGRGTWGSRPIQPGNLLPLPPPHPHKTSEQTASPDLPARATPPRLHGMKKDLPSRTTADASPSSFSSHQQQQHANVRPYTDRREERWARGRTCGERPAHPPTHHQRTCLSRCLWWTKAHAVRRNPSSLDGND